MGGNLSFGEFWIQEWLTINSKDLDKLEGWKAHEAQEEAQGSPCLSADWEHLAENSSARRDLGFTADARVNMSQQFTCILNKATGPLGYAR